MSPRALQVAARSLAADGAVDAVHELQHSAPHRCALRVGQRVADVAFGTGEGAVVVVIRGDRMLARIDLDSGLILGEQDPIPLPLREFPPWLVDVVAERDQDVA